MRGRSSWPAGGPARSTRGSRLRSAFEAAGLPAESAIERLTAASHLRSAASFTASLELLAVTHALAVEAGRSDLEARALGLEGNVRARMGDATEGLPLVRRGLGMALDLGLTTAAAELYQRLADSLEHAGTYDPARAAYLEGAEYCRTRSIEPTAQLCLACMAVVLWQTGDWPGAERTSREVVTSSDATPHAIGGGRRDRRDGRGDARERASRPPASGEVAADRSPHRARGDGDHLVLGARSLRPARRRWTGSPRSMPRHPGPLGADRGAPLRRTAASLGDELFSPTPETRPQVRACTDALATIAAQTGQPEAVAALGNALAEAAHSRATTSRRSPT